MKTLTEEQAKALIVPFDLNFVRYYKYSFNWINNNSTFSVHASFGGDPDDIYRYEFTIEDLHIPIQNINDLKNLFTYFSITRLSDSASFDFYQDFT